MILCDVSPVDHVLPFVAEEVNVTDPPSQNVSGPLAIRVGVAGNGVTTTSTVAGEEEQPFSVIRTVYVPDSETVMFWVVSLVDHIFPLAEDEVSVTDPPSQKVRGPSAVIVGVVGMVFTVTVTGVVSEEEQPFSVTFTE